jgi:hypothetical protein
MNGVLITTIWLMGKGWGPREFPHLILGSMSDTFAGAIPTTYYSFGYQYITYNVSVEAKNNPSSYQIKSYDASDALLKTTVVTPSTDLTTLSLPGSRAYSIVEEYQNGGLVNSSSQAKQRWHNPSLFFQGFWPLR